MEEFNLINNYIQAFLYKLIMFIKIFISINNLLKIIIFNIINIIIHLKFHIISFYSNINYIYNHQYYYIIKILIIYYLHFHFIFFQFLRIKTLFHLHN